MLFNSLQFLLFLPLTVIVYFSLPFKYRWAFLLAGSYFFYMCWRVEYIFLIIASTLIDYYSGIKIEESKNKKTKKKFLFLSLFFNLGLLGLFKYYNFFTGNIESGLNSMFNFSNGGIDLPYFDFLLPVGISFYTFQTLSYTIDVYKGRKSAERHLGIFALYVSFFPQLVAGPIERSVRLLPQFKQQFNFDYTRVVSGLRLITWGFFQKVVIADSIARYVDAVYNNVENYTGFPLILSTLFFAIQIYNDFAGYSNIAIGSARLMGYDLMKNFNQPYLSKNLADFWRKWHISLYSWFNDYLYNGIVLKYRDWGMHAVSFSAIITFTLSGLWHGAAWTFVIWGLLHGIGLSFLIYSNKTRKKINKILPKSLYSIFCVTLTFSFVNFTYIFFRSNDIHDVFFILRHIFDLDLNYIIGVPIFTSPPPF